MKRLILILLILSISLSAWSEERKMDPVHFKLRDFKFEVEEKEYNVTYKGRGLLVAELPAMQAGSYFVFLKARDRHTRQVASELIVVIVSDGIGELNLTLFYPKSEKPTGPPQFIWDVIGYVPLLPATMSSD